MDESFRELLNRVADRHAGAGHASGYGPAKGTFRFFSFLTSFVMVGGSLYVIANLNNIQSQVSSTGPVGLMAIVFGLIFVLYAGRMARTAVASVNPMTDRSDPHWPVRVSRAWGAFVGMVVGIGPITLATGMFDRLQAILRGFQ